MTDRDAAVVAMSGLLTVFMEYQQKAQTHTNRLSLIALKAASSGQAILDHSLAGRVELHSSGNLTKLIEYIDVQIGCWEEMEECLNLLKDDVAEFSSGLARVWDTYRKALGSGDTK